MNFDCYGDSARCEWVRGVGQMEHVKAMSFTLFFGMNQCQERRLVKIYMYLHSLQFCMLAQ